MGRANRGAKGGGALRESASGAAAASTGTIESSAFESDIGKMENALGSNLDGLRKMTGSGYDFVSRLDALEHSGVFERAVSEIIYKGDIQRLSEVMEIVDPNFNKEQFLGEVLDANGEFTGATSEDFSRAVLKEMKENFNLEKAVERELGGGRHSEEDLLAKGNDIIGAILDDPQGNRYFHPGLDKDLWTRQTNIAKISDAWERAGGSEELLSGRMDPVETVAASAGLLHYSDIRTEGVTHYTDRESDKYFIEKHPGTSAKPLIYGDKRSYNMVVGEEDRTVNVEEVRNKDGQALRLSSHGIEVSVVRAANPDENGEPVTMWDTGDGPQRVKEVDWMAGSMENFGIRKLYDKIEESGNPLSQTDRLFDTISSV